ncbi:Zinc metallopeptidase [Pseudoalteromonas maricaloris]
MVDFHYLFYLFLSSLHSWILLFVALFNFVRATKNPKFKQLSGISFLLAGSYFLTIPTFYFCESKGWLTGTAGFYDLSIYFIFLFLDISTILLLVKLFKFPEFRLTRVVKSYVIGFLTVNSFLFVLIISEDIITNHRVDKEYRDWVYWLYTIGMYITDWLLIVVLLIPKDFLGLYAIIKERRWPLFKTDIPRST